MKNNKIKTFLWPLIPIQAPFNFSVFPYTKIPPIFLFSSGLKSILIKLLSSPHHSNYFCQEPQWLPYYQIHQLIPCPHLTWPSSSNLIELITSLWNTFFSLFPTSHSSSFPSDSLVSFGVSSSFPDLHTLQCSSAPLYLYSSPWQSSTASRLKVSQRS